MLRPKGSKNAALKSRRRGSKGVVPGLVPGIHVLTT